MADRKLTNDEIADVLDQIADLLETQLQELPNIGERIARIIASYVRTGRSNILMAWSERVDRAFG